MTPNDERPASGHRSVPHTADTRIEAWAPDRERCLAEAVLALVESFAATAAARPVRSVALRMDEGPAEDMLVSVLDEVIYRLEVEGELPVDVEVAEAPDGGLEVRLAMADARSVPASGAVPKAVSLQHLRFSRGAEGWTCAVTIDV